MAPNHISSNELIHRKKNQCYMYVHGEEEEEEEERSASPEPESHSKYRKAI